MIDEREAARQAARASNPGLYDSAFNHPTARSIWNNQLAQIINTDVGRRAVNQAEEAIRQLRASTQNSTPFISPIVEVRNPNGPGTILTISGGNGPNLEFWDQVKRSLQR